MYMLHLSDRHPPNHTLHLKPFSHDSNLAGVPCLIWAKFRFVWHSNVWTVSGEIFSNLPSFMETQFCPFIRGAFCKHLTTMLPFSKGPLLNCYCVKGTQNVSVANQKSSFAAQSKLSVSVQNMFRWSGWSCLTFHHWDPSSNPTGGTINVDKVYIPHLTAWIFPGIILSLSSHI